MQRKTREHPEHAKETWMGTREQMPQLQLACGQSTAAEKIARVTCGGTTKQCLPFFPEDRKTTLADKAEEEPGDGEEWQAFHLRNGVIA